MMAEGSAGKSDSGRVKDNGKDQGFAGGSGDDGA